MALDNEELEFIGVTVDAVIRGDREFVNRIPKAPLWDEAVFWENADSLNLTKTDGFDPATASIIIFPADKLEFEFVVVGLRPASGLEKEERERNGVDLAQFVVMFVRPLNGGPLALLSIGEG